MLQPKEFGSSKWTPNPRASLVNRLPRSPGLFTPPGRIGPRDRRPLWFPRHARPGRRSGRGGAPRVPLQGRAPGARSPRAVGRRALPGRGGRSEGRAPPTSRGWSLRPGASGAAAGNAPRVWGSPRRGSPAFPGRGRRILEDSGPEPGGGHWGGRTRTLPSPDPDSLPLSLPRGDGPAGWDWPGAAGRRESPSVRSLPHWALVTAVSGLGQRLDLFSHLPGISSISFFIRSFLSLTPSQAHR